MKMVAPKLLTCDLSHILFPLVLVIDLDVWSVRQYLVWVSHPVPKLQWQAVLILNIFREISSYSTDSEHFQNQLKRYF